MGSLGYTLVVFTLLIGAVLAQGWRSAGILCATVALILWLQPTALAPLRSWRMWFMFALVGGSVWLLRPILQPTDELLSGWVLLRGLTIVLLLSFYVQSVGLGELALLLERLGVQGLGFALGVALNMLPLLLESLRNTWAALRMRGGLRRRRWQTLQRLLVTVLANGLRRADEITAAAEARGYHPARAARAEVRLQRVDLLWELVAVTSVGVLLLLP